MAKKYWVILGVLAVLLIAGGGAWYFLGSNTDSDSQTTSGLPPDRIQPDDHVMGAANAPVTMIEYFAQACSACAAFDQQVFPLLKAKYIDTGKVRYVMRLFPLFPIDEPAYNLDTCAPNENFFQAADMLFKNQPQWDTAEYKDADPNGLMRMAHLLGLSDGQAESCMRSTAHRDRMNQVAHDGDARYSIPGTPTFVIDFQKADFAHDNWDEVQTALDAALKAKGVP
jgi:protein-disulfide isomerase